jgi:hypothetical protein
MVKIGLLTWAYNNNYGTILQMYALSSTIHSLGYCVEIINYVQKNVRIPFIKRLLKCPRFTINNVRIKTSNWLYFKYNEEINSKIEKFNLFRQEKFVFSELCDTVSDWSQLNDKYAAFVCGSDQIWNPSFFDGRYYLDFVQDTNKMIAYAPSIGVTSIYEKNTATKMAQAIKRFKYLSVREDKGKDIIYNLTGQNASVVLDPTLLFDSKTWDVLINDVDKPKKEYILCYFLGYKGKYWRIVKKISKAKNMPVKVIPRYNKDCTRKFDIQSCTGIGDFLKLFRDATLVCTDSFHGTIFSILYKKPFLAFERFARHDPRSENSRIYSLLKMVSLEDRIVSNCNIGDLVDKEIDFDLIELSLNGARKKSIRFLSDALKKAAIEDLRI